MGVTGGRGARFAGPQVQWSSTEPRRMFLGVYRVLKRAIAFIEEARLELSPRGQSCQSFQTDEFPFGSPGDCPVFNRVSAALGIPRVG